MIDTEALRALAEALQALVPKLTDLRAQQVLDPIELKVAHTNDPNARGAFAKVIQALAPKLAESQVQQAFRLSSSSLARAISEDEAEEWARSLVTLSLRLRDQKNTEGLVAAITYPPPLGQRLRSCLRRSELETQPHLRHRPERPQFLNGSRRNTFGFLIRRSACNRRCSHLYRTSNALRG